MYTKNLLNIFFAGSFISIFTFIYLGKSYYNSNRPSSIPIELFPIFLPIIYGVSSIITYIITSNYGNNYSFIVGATLGLLLSFIGRFYFSYPIKIFKLNKEKAYVVHILAPIYYGLLFRFIVTPLTKFIIKK